MKPNIFLTAIIYVSALSACMHQKHTIITRSTNGDTKKIEYTGMVAFSKDTGGGVVLSPNSWFKYKEGDIDLKVDCDESGHQHYSLNGNHRSTQPTAEEKSALARAAQFAAENKVPSSHS